MQEFSSFTTRVSQRRKVKDFARKTVEACMKSFTYLTRRDVWKCLRRDEHSRACWLVCLFQCHWSSASSLKTSGFTFLVNQIMAEKKRSTSRWCILLININQKLYILLLTVAVKAAFLTNGCYCVQPWWSPPNPSPVGFYRVKMAHRGIVVTARFESGPLTTPYSPSVCLEITIK